MFNAKQIDKLKAQGRKMGLAKPGDDDLGILKQLPGTWANGTELKGSGWNVIALPFAANKEHHYRLLVNQYNEEHTFSLVDKAVPNRGIGPGNDGPIQTDQFVVTLDYVQQITQMAADDFPVSGEDGGANLAIHHEPGLFLQMTNEFEGDLEIARLSSIPHGNSLLALGKFKQYDGPPVIPQENGFPIGVKQDLANPYLTPYKHFNDNPFKEVFNPLHPNELLRKTNEGVNIVRTTELHFDTKFGTGGIHNIPFVQKQAAATEMHATFWIQELAEKDKDGNPKLRLQYSQTVFLEFFKSKIDPPSLIKWPHVSINTMQKQ